MKAHLRLTLDVVYETNSTPVEDLVCNLNAIPHLAAGEAMMSGETDAEVDVWTHKVEIVP